MNRREFLGKTALATLFAGTSPVLLGAQPEAPKSASFKVRFTTAPSLQCPTADGVTVAIGVDGPSTAWVEYGETEALGQTAWGSRDGLKPFANHAHHIPLAPLPPGRRIFYRVRACPIDFRGPYDIRRGEEISTDVFSFQTFDPQAAQARFVVWNDTHENAATLQALMRRTRTLPSDFLVWNGDVTDVNQEERIPIQYFSPAGQPFTRDMPLIFVRGNHDTRGAAARALHRFVHLPGNRFYYSFRHGPVAGIVLDTGEDKLDTHPVYAGLGDFDRYRQEQSRWLEAELKRPEISQAPFRVVFCHIPCARREGVPAFASTDPRSGWHQVFVQGKVAAVVSGHTHRHACLPPDENRPYAQLIGGGPAEDNATLIRGEVTRERLKLSIQDLHGEELAAWTAET